MKSTRKLSLRRERLTELSADQLDGLAGGLAAADSRIVIYTGTTGVLTSACPTNNPCQTLDSKCATDYRTQCCGVVAIEA